MIAHRLIEYPSRRVIQNRPPLNLYSPPKPGLPPGSDGRDDVFGGNGLEAKVVGAAAGQAVRFRAGAVFGIEVGGRVHLVGADAGWVVGAQEGNSGDPQGQGQVEGAAVVGHE